MKPTEMFQLVAYRGINPAPVALTVRMPTQVDVRRQLNLPLVVYGHFIRIRAREKNNFVAQDGQIELFFTDQKGQS